MIAARRQVPQRHRTTLGRARKVPQIPPTARDQGRERSLAGTRLRVIAPGASHCRT